MYNKEIEKSRVLGMLKASSQGEIQNNKQQNFQRAISLAKDELDDFEKIFNKFISDVSHLEVFQHAFKEPLTRDVEKMAQNLRYLVERNYSKEETENMPEEVLNQVKASQEKRFELLKRIAVRYLQKPKD